MIRTLCTLSKFANNTKLGGVVDVSDACAAIQRVLDRLERWANRKLMFNKGKSQVLQLELEQPPAPVYAVSSPDRKQLCRKTSCGPWRTVSWTHTSNTCCLTAKKVNSLLGCIMKSFVSRSRKMFLLYSALVRNIWCARSSPGLSSSTDMDTLVQFQQRATNMLKELKRSPVLQKSVFFDFFFILTQFVSLWQVGVVGCMEKSTILKLISPQHQGEVWPKQAVQLITNIDKWDLTGASREGIKQEHLSTDFSLCTFSILFSQHWCNNQKKSELLTYIGYCSN